MITWLGEVLSFCVGAAFIILLTFLVIGFASYWIQLRWYEWRNK